MTSESIWIAFFLAALVGGFLASKRAHAAGRREAELEAAPLRERAEAVEARLREADARAEELRARLEAALGEKSGLEVKAARIPELEEELRQLRERLDAQSRELQDLAGRNASLDAQVREIRAREPEMREALAHFLQEKGKALTQQNTESLKVILDPLRTRIQDFEKKVDAVYDKEAEQRISLKKEVEMLHRLNQRISEEAQNLTLALKGENKTGGNWGEVVLERVLESSGLEKGREYRVQPSFAGEDGVQRPDVVIDLPDNRHLVVDSKLSLVAYERYCAATDPAEADAALAAHVQSVRMHIDQLAGKKYHEIHSLNSVDFVFLFMPVEPAFIEASRRDSSLFHTAFAKNIVIVSPSTLLATLRTVASIWKQEHQNRNVREIARQAGALYDKFVGFVADLDNVEKSLNKTRETFNEAKSKLTLGRGNLVTRVETLRKLGAKSGKTLPASWREDAEASLDLADATDDGEESHSS